jgi:acyl-coenzyme A thioesterase PaaI-like protein
VSVQNTIVTRGCREQQRETAQASVLLNLEVRMIASEMRADPRAFLALLPFVQAFAIRVVSAAPGQVTLRMPFLEPFSTPPNHFPASMVGLLGDVAAAASCISLLPRGWTGATLDYTIKMTGRAQGKALLARGRVLQAGRTVSVGAADIFTRSDAQEALCGTVLATTRNFEIKD